MAASIIWLQTWLWQLVFICDSLYLWVLYHRPAGMIIDWLWYSIQPSWLGFGIHNTPLIEMPCYFHAMLQSKYYLPDILHDCLIVYSLLLRYLRVHHCTHTGFLYSQVLKGIYLLFKQEDRTSEDARNQ